METKIEDIRMWEDNPPFYPTYEEWKRDMLSYT